MVQDKPGAVNAKGRSTTAHSPAERAPRANARAIPGVPAVIARRGSTNRGMATLVPALPVPVVNILRRKGLDRVPLVPPENSTVAPDPRPALGATTGNMSVPTIARACRARRESSTPI